MGWQKILRFVWDDGLPFFQGNAELNSKGTGSTFKAIGRKVLEDTLVPNIGLDKQKECDDFEKKSVIQRHEK
jgi:hypothetical protein